MCGRFDVGRHMLFVRYDNLIHLTHFPETCRPPELRRSVYNNEFSRLLRRHESIKNPFYFQFVPTTNKWRCRIRGRRRYFIRALIKQFRDQTGFVY